MMENVRQKIADRACMRTGSTLSPHASPHLFESLVERVWDLINDRVWFPVYDPVCGRAPVSIPPDLVTIKANRSK